jgi:glycosyltransferase involved in cell wall biosynthesis
LLTKFLKKDSAIKFIFGNRVKNEADQKKKDEVVAKLTQAGIVDQVRFTDTWKEMPKLYNLSDVIVFPVGNMRGKFDIPLAIIEPYACEKPVILSDLEIFQEFSKPDFSVTIPRNDSDALWQAIEDLRANEDKRKTLGKNARAFTKQFFDLKETARKYETLYRE